MRKLRNCFFALLVFSMPLTASSCSSEDEATGTELASDSVVMIALDAWASKGDKVQAQAADTLILANGSVMLDFLKNNPNALGTDVQNALNNMLNGVDPIIAEAVTEAAKVLDKYLPAVPTGAMTSAGMEIVTAFVQGCVDGAEAATAAVVVNKTKRLRILAKANIPEHSVWIRPKS